MAINWQNLRSWNGSQHLGFEELCCQLAACEQVPYGSRFIRKGTPDGGVECFWILPNGDEWGWQAKYFLSSPDVKQWSQIDDSVKKALEKHPRLISFTVCLPVDRQDPRIEGQIWFMDKWNEHVEEWKAWAQKLMMSVEVNYWGEHEIYNRLSREENRGRYFFWFNEEFFSQQWFENRLEEAVANVADRYTPNLNVELPPGRLFDGLGRSPRFYAHVKELYGNLVKACSKVFSSNVAAVGEDKFGLLWESIDDLAFLKTSEETGAGAIDWESISSISSMSQKIAGECIDYFDLIDNPEVHEDHAFAGRKNSGQGRKFSFERSSLYTLIKRFRDLNHFAKDSEALLSNVPALLLVGEAGTGKTHLFCDVAKRRTTLKAPTVLLSGNHFKDDEPWSQIIRQLGLSCGKDEFLGALEAAAQVHGKKTLILIDALNEGEGRKLWHKYIAGMLTTLSRYPWIAVAFSVRTSYEAAVIPEGLVPNRLIREVHYGFAEHEYEATRTFFDHFGIERPGIPLLVPEFQNPLFLMLFCKGMKERGFPRVSEGLQGITAIFEFFIDSINEKLSKSEHLDFDQKSKLVQKALETLAQTMADRSARWLSREEAKQLVNSFLPREGYESTLFRHLISEGLIAEDVFLAEDDEWQDIIRFGYERFSDHLIAKHLLKRHLDPTNPSSAFLSGQPLESFFRDEYTCWENQGLIEAFSIQLPERIEKELVELVPACAEYQPISEAFLDSLIWRRPDAVTGAALQYINEQIVRYEYTHDRFWDVLLTVATNPDHPYNADFLHDHLFNQEPAERDSWWSIFLHREYGAHMAVDRIIEWAWSIEDKVHINDSSIRLCGITLGWFLTTPNRHLRDRATKALVSLFTPRIHVLREVISEFLRVNDLYVAERLFAAAYGCAMRSTDTHAVRELAKDVYHWVFENGAPPPHILLRDYARGVIESVLSNGTELDVAEENVRPPYKSEWKGDAPSENELLDNYRTKDGYYAIWRSLMYNLRGFTADFGNYIVNSSLLHWSSRRLHESRKPSRKEVYENFVSSLTGRQKAAFSNYETIRSLVEVQERSGYEDDSHSDQELTKRDHSKRILTTERALRRVLGKKKLKLFEEYVLPYLDEPHIDEYAFDFAFAQRWIFQRVLELGWSVERFGKIDAETEGYLTYSRGSHKSERISKKYQWIAYHEFLARVSDHFEFIEYSRAKEPGQYEGPWQINRRDIDPSCLLKKTEREVWGHQPNNWWFTSPYDTWDSEPDDLAWLKSNEDLPAIEPLIEAKSPEDDSKWLVLEAYYTWKPPIPLGEDRYETPRRDIWYMLKSYIVKKNKMDELFSWAEKQNFMGRWMPESHEQTDIFLGEFFHYPAFEYHDVPYHGHDGWTRQTRNYNEPPCEVLVTTDQYMQEDSGYDCSIDETINIYLPAKWIVENMKLKWNGVEGHFYDNCGNLIAFDPSVKLSGPGALLIKKGAFRQFLDSSGHDVLWTVIGEKDIIGGKMTQEKWKGRLEISGAYRIDQNRIHGGIHTWFLSRS